MSTFDLIVTPNDLSMALRGNTGLSTAPATGSTQTIDRGGLRWVCSYNYGSLRGRDRAEMMALLAQLRAQSNRLRVTVKDNPTFGTYGGTPLVAGASQTGSSIDIDGCTPSVSEWIAKGDYFSIIVNGEPELKMATASVASDGGGALTIPFEPKLRESPADNAAIYVDDGVLTPPQGVFMLANPENGWRSRPGVNSKIGSMSLNLIEDIFSTQA